MKSPIFIYHQDLKSSGSEALPPLAGFLPWRTCVRSLLVGTQPAPELEAHGVDVFAGAQALEFLTEVVCGLRSPMLGETEVHGQFKKLLDENKQALDGEVYRSLLAVHFLARKIRQEHLSNLGCQSYGSYTRKKLAEHQSVLVLGAGQLAQEIVPWLQKSKAELTLMCRRPEKVPEKIRELAAAQIVGLGPVRSAPQALVVAAPLPSQAIVNEVFGEALRPRVTLDLRGESAHDPLCSSFSAISLRDVFSEIESNRKISEEKVNRAREAIQESVLDLDQVVGRKLASIKVS